MATQELPSLNDIAPSWADISASFSIFGGQILELVDFAALSWSDKVEVGMQRGASGGRVLKRTTGQLDSEATATLYRSGYRKLLRALVEKAQSRGNQKLISLVGFDILVQWTPPGEVDIYTLKIKGCRLLGRSEQSQEGSDAEKIEITLNPIEIAEIVDGVEIVLL